MLLPIESVKHMGLTPAMPTVEFNVFAPTLVCSPERRISCLRPVSLLNNTSFSPFAQFGNSCGFSFPVQPLIINNNFGQPTLPVTSQVIFTPHAFENSNLSYSRSFESGIPSVSLRIAPDITASCNSNRNLVSGTMNTCSMPSSAGNLSNGLLDPVDAARQLNTLGNRHCDPVNSHKPSLQPKPFHGSISLANQIMSLLEKHNLYPIGPYENLLEALLVEYRFNKRRYKFSLTPRQKLDFERLLSAVSPMRKSAILSFYHQLQTELFPELPLGPLPKCTSASSFSEVQAAVLSSASNLDTCFHGYQPSTFRNTTSSLSSSVRNLDLHHLHQIPICVSFVTNTSPLCSKVIAIQMPTQVEASLSQWQAQLRKESRRPMIVSAFSLAKVPPQSNVKSPTPTSQKSVSLTQLQKMLSIDRLKSVLPPHSPQKSSSKHLPPTLEEMVDQLAPFHVFQDLDNTPESLAKVDDYLKDAFITLDTRKRQAEEAVNILFHLPKLRRIQCETDERLNISRLNLDMEREFFFSEKSLYEVSLKLWNLRHHENGSDNIQTLIDVNFVPLIFDELNNATPANLSFLKSLESHEKHTDSSTTTFQSSSKALDDFLVDECYVATSLSPDCTALPLSSDEINSSSQDFIDGGKSLTHSSCLFDSLITEEHNGRHTTSMSSEDKASLERFNFAEDKDVPSSFDSVIMSQTREFIDFSGGNPSFSESSHLLHDDDLAESSYNSYNLDVFLSAGLEKELYNWSEWELSQILGIPQTVNCDSSVCLLTDINTAEVENSSNQHSFTNTDASMRNYSSNFDTRGLAILSELCEPENSDDPDFETAIRSILES